MEKVAIITFTISLLLVLFPLDGSAQEYITGSVMFNISAPNNVTYIPGVVNASAVAYGDFNDTLHYIGWGLLSLNGQNTPDITGSTPDFVQAYAMGYLEGHLTHKRIYENFNVTLSGWYGEYGGAIPQSIVDWFTSNIEWIDGMLDTPALNSYWYNVKIVRCQLQGLLDAYNENYPDETYSLFDIWLIQSMGDLEDVSSALIPSEYVFYSGIWMINDPRRSAISPPDYLNINPFSEEKRRERDYPHHCTGFVKMLPSLEDVFFAQDTWSAYGTMNRILKDYITAYSHPSILSHEVTFSSYAGILFSVDDFYLTDAGLAVLETTFNIFNHTLYDLYLTPSTVLTWMRVQIANKIATNGPEWVQAITKYNSGTYNNQWVVMDNKLFEAGKVPLPNFLYVVEMIPGNTWEGDETTRLELDTYYPSINAPSNEYLFNISGYEEMVITVGDYWSYWNCSRMKIIQRNESEITSFERFKEFMRYNHYKTDPLSNGDPAQAIASRYDLRTTKSFPFGCIDTKATNTRLARDLAFHAHSGPPGIETGLPIYVFPEAPMGLPKSWNFTFYPYTPPSSALPCSELGDCTSCTANTVCGWCSSGGCMRGDSFSPYSGVCTEGWWFKSCPSHPADKFWLIVGMAVGAVFACTFVVVVAAIVFFGTIFVKKKFSVRKTKETLLGKTSKSEYANLDNA